MGHFYYSHIKVPLDPTKVTADIVEIAHDLWGGEFVVERIDGIPTTPQDHRVAMWCVNHRDAEANGWDADFSLSLHKDNRFEFKVPRTRWDESFGRQQRLRQRLVLRYNGALSKKETRALAPYAEDV